MKRILVPTDFSVSAAVACDVALDIAQRAGADLYFIHFHPMSKRTMHVPAEVPEMYSKEVEETQAIVTGKLQSLVNKAERRSIKARLIPVFRPEDSLEKYVDSFAIDLIVMGPKGVAGIRNLFITSNTLHVIRHTKTPVLVVREKSKTDFRKIIFAYNFEEDLIKPMKVILEWVRIFQADLGLLFINVPYNFKTTDEMTADIKRFMHQFRDVHYTVHIYNATNEERGINQFLTMFQPDLLAVVTHGKTGFKGLLFHSIAEKLLKDITIPILVMNIADL